MDPKAAVTAPATSNASAAVGELPDISTTEYKFIKPHHFADFFAKNKFSGAAQRWLPGAWRGLAPSAERFTRARLHERMQRELIDKEAEFGPRRPNSLEATAD